MKIKKAKVINFGSYSELEFNFNELGLALIYGPTGSGKSTLQDVISWILYGSTSKNGNADDIRSWINLDQKTEGFLEVESEGKLYIVYRSRGKSGQNDLYIKLDDEIFRGKDIKETQILIETVLRATEEEYRTAALFNEFSPTNGFFTAKGRERRLLFDNLADLTFPSKLTEKISEANSSNRKQQQEIVNLLNVESGKSHIILKTLSQLRTSSKKWEEEKAQEKEIYKAKELELKKKIERFDKEKDLSLVSLNTSLISSQNRLDKLQAAEFCPTCKAEKNPQSRNLRQKLETNISLLTNKIEFTNSQINPYIHQAVQFKIDEFNPFVERIESLEDNYKEHELVKHQLEESLSLLKEESYQLDKLTDISDQLRVELLKRSIKDIQDKTNDIIERNFNGELKVNLTLDNGDSLDVRLSKNGHEAVYKQLSKGQRGILRLAFGVAVMERCSNKIGIHFNVLQFDEALEGLDNDLKVKAFGIFEELSLKHGSVLIVEHSSEFQQLFNKRFKVSIEADISSIVEE